MLKTITFFLLLVALSQCGTMWGFSDFGFYQVDLTSGELNKIFDIPPFFSSAHTGASDVDQKNGIFYLLGDCSGGYLCLLGIDLNTKTIKYVMDIPLQAGIEEAGAYIAVDQTTSTIYVSGDVGSHHALLTADPRTNKTQVVATWRQGNGILGIGGACFDSKNKIFWVNLMLDSADGVGVPGIGTYGIDVTKKSLSFIVNASLQIETWDYDPVSGYSYGIGLSISPKVARVLVRLDGSNGNFNIVGTIPHHLLLDGSVTTFDPQNGYVYVILDGSLVSTSVKNAGVVASLGLDCNMQFDCPLNLGYWVKGT